MKRVLSVILIIVMLVLAISSLTACSNTSKLVNEWICDTRDFKHGDYPVVMNLFDDGTGILNDYANTNEEYTEWQESNGFLYLTGIFNYTQTYHITFEGDKLYLDDFSYHIREAGEEPPAAPRYTLKTK